MDSMLLRSWSRWLSLALLLAFGLSLPSCRWEADDPGTDRSSSLAPLAIEKALTYSGKDSLVLSTIARLKSLPEAKSFALTLARQRLSPLWNRAIHIGQINQEECLFIPVHRQGEEEITRIWVINAVPGKELLSVHM